MCHWRQDLWTSGFCGWNMWRKKGGHFVYRVFCIYFVWFIHMHGIKYESKRVCVYIYMYVCYFWNSAYTPQGLAETRQCRKGRDGYNVYTYNPKESPWPGISNIFCNSRFFHVFPLLKWDAGMAKVLGPPRFCCISSGTVGIYCWWRFWRRLVCPPEPCLQSPFNGLLQAVASGIISELWEGHLPGPRFNCSPFIWSEFSVYLNLIQKQDTQTYLVTEKGFCLWFPF